MKTRILNELKNKLVLESGLPVQSFDVEQNKILLHINMCGVPLPDGECDNFVFYF